MDFSREKERITRTQKQSRFYFSSDLNVNIRKQKTIKKCSLSLTSVLLQLAYQIHNYQKMYLM